MHTSNTNDVGCIEEARQAALDVLRHNLRGPFMGLPRTAGWGYPEPYTRDLLISSLGVLVSGDESLIDGWEQVFELLARNQSARGHIPSLVHDPEDRGASDTTPLFLLTLGMWRRARGKAGWLEEAAARGGTWMEYQRPDDRVLVGQLPTSDWRDEQWVLGYGLYVNTITYAYLRLFGRCDEAAALGEAMKAFEVSRPLPGQAHVHDRLRGDERPYLRLWTYKVLGSDRFDLLGNSLALLAGVVVHEKAERLVDWVELQCSAMHEDGTLGLNLPPNLFPFVLPEDPDWQFRCEEFNRPATYHNGGVWPFVCAFWVAALVAVGRHELARQKLGALTRLVKPARGAGISWGFNEWLRPEDGCPCGQDWQTWSAAAYLYAVAAVETGQTPFFDCVRSAG